MTRQAYLPVAWQNRATEFRCVHCRALISSNPLISGVMHRNHCPVCLRSRHMDLHSPGDRLAACRSLMLPVGLTLKRSRKKYPSHAQGELMLIHLCTNCGKLSINRIAADDDAQHILKLLEQRFDLDHRPRLQLARQGINILTNSERGIVQAQLFGSCA